MTTVATGHVEVRDRGGGPVFYAKLKLPDGSQPRRRLGRVWAKRSRPPQGHLTRAQAEARLTAILAGEDPAVEVAPSTMTFGAACDEHLRYLEFDLQRKRSTIRDARSTINHRLRPRFGADTPLSSITSEVIDAYRDDLLAECSHRTAQKTLVLLGGILGRARRKGWIAANPFDNVERVLLRRSDEFNVLSIEQVHFVARAASSEQVAALIAVAAFTGLRQGELLALRWRHVDFANRGRSWRTPRSRTASVAFRCPTRPSSRSTRSAAARCSPTTPTSSSSTRPGGTSKTTGCATTSTGRSSRPDSGTSATASSRPTRTPAASCSTTRSSFMTCAARGIDLRRIQAWMGHADIQTTMRYLHYVPAHDDAARLTAAFATDEVGTQTGTEPASTGAN
jgi:integrase